MSRLLERFGKTWGDAARDVVLIVASILIAFGLDTWWDDLKERRVRSEQIVTLMSEFEVAKDTLTSLSGYLDDAAAATNELLTLMGPEAAGLESEKIFTLLERSLNFGAVAPNYTALESVLTTSNPQVETSDTLVALLGNWPGQMEDLENDFAQLDRNRDIDLQAALVEIGIAGIAATPMVQKLGLPASPFPIDLDRLVQSVNVYAALSYRALRLKVLFSNVGGALEDLDLIIEELARVSNQDAR